MDIRDAFFNQLYEIALQDKNVIVLTADMGVNEFARFRELKGQFYNVGISEQNMVSIAAGLALSGRKVYVYTMASFLQRAFEQIKIDICQMNLPVTIIGGCVGLSNSTDGYTHYSINDITCMRTLSNLTIYNPSCGVMAGAFARMSYESKSPLYIRLDKGDFYEPYINSFSFGAGLRQPRRHKISIIATSNMVSRALELGYGVIDLYRLSPLNAYTLKLYLEGIKQLFTLEEHLTCGLGSIISEFLTDNNLNIPLTRLGVTKTSPIGSREYMQKLNGLDVESLKETICQNSQLRTSVNVLEGLPKTAKG